MLTSRMLGVLAKQILEIKNILAAKDLWNQAAVIHVGNLSPLFQELVNESQNKHKKIRVADIDGRQVFVHWKEIGYTVFAKNGDVLLIDGMQPSPTKQKSFKVK